jgi:hypothetical protein
MRCGVPQTRRQQVASLHQGRSDKPNLAIGHLLQIALGVRWQKGLRSMQPEHGRVLLGPGGSERTRERRQIRVAAAERIRASWSTVTSPTSSAATVTLNAITGGRERSAETIPAMCLFIGREPSITTCSDSARSQGQSPATARCGCHHSSAEVRQRR